MASTPIIKTMIHAGVLVLVFVLFSFCSSKLVAVSDLSSTSVWVTLVVVLSSLVWILFCLSLCVCRVVLVVLTGYCLPVLSGWLHVVSSITSSILVVVLPVSDDCDEVCTSVCETVCCSRSFFCSVCTDSALFVAVLLVLQLTANRAISRVRAIVDFLNSACKFAQVFT